MLSRGRVDAAVGSESGIIYALNNSGIKEQKWKKSYILGSKEWWVHLSNKSKDSNLIPALKKAVKKLYKPNLIYKLYQKQLSKK
ncbi:MAG: polar amino acid transport system substrate-binding protein [bacterium]|jgi:polar amino acid transport system substrate-binding protein